VQINSASDNTESAPEGKLQGATIPLGDSGGDAPINSVTDSPVGPTPGNAVTTISVDEGSIGTIKSAADTSE
jgi:hypothetical protein